MRQGIEETCEKSGACQIAVRIINQIICLFVFLASTASGQAPKTLTTQDVQNLKAITSIAISPSGSQILYTIEESDLQQNTRVESIWLVSVSGKKSAKIANDAIPS